MRDTLVILWIKSVTLRRKRDVWFIFYNVATRCQTNIRQPAHKPSTANRTVNPLKPSAHRLLLICRNKSIRFYFGGLNHPQSLVLCSLPWKKAATSFTPSVESVTFYLLVFFYYLSINGLVLMLFSAFKTFQNLN